jgi:hypothetical protein
MILGVSLGAPRVLRLYGPSWNGRMSTDEFVCTKETEYVDILLESGSVYFQRYHITPTLLVLRLTLPLSDDIRYKFQHSILSGSSLAKSTLQNSSSLFGQRLSIMIRVSDFFLSWGIATYRNARFYSLSRTTIQSSLLVKLFYSKTKLLVIIYISLVRLNDYQIAWLQLGVEEPERIYGSFRSVGRHERDLNTPNQSSFQHLTRSFH